MSQYFQLGDIMSYRGRVVRVIADNHSQYPIEFTVKDLESGERTSGIQFQELDDIELDDPRISGDEDAE